MGSYQGKRRFRRQKQSRRRPPRRMAGCGHIVYSWRDVERCNVCAGAGDDLNVESLRDFRARLQRKGLL